MSAEDMIAAVSRRHRLTSVSGGTATGSTWVCGCGETARTPGTRGWAETLHARHVTAAVVAAIRGMSVEQQAELLDGVVGRSEARTGYVRVVGPWRAEP